MPPSSLKETLLKIIRRVSIILISLTIVGILWGGKADKIHISCRSTQGCICNGLHIINICFGNNSILFNSLMPGANTNSPQIADPYPFILDENVTQSLLSIPEEKLYYYIPSDSNDNNSYRKIKLYRTRDKVSVYFTTVINGKVKRRAGREILVGTWPGIPDIKLSPIFDREHLKEKKDNTSGFVVLTTDTSRFTNTIQMAQYLSETYDVIKYAEPNFRIEVPSNEFESDDESVEIIGELVKKTPLLYISEWDYLYPLDGKTLKEAYNLFHEKLNISDLSFLDYRSEQMDSSGKATYYQITTYSPSQQRVYSLKIAQTTIGSIVNPAASLDNKEASRYVWWEKKDPSEYHFWPIEQVKDSPQQVVEAMKEKGECIGKLSFTIIPVHQNTVIDCMGTAYWNAEIPLFQTSTL